MSDDQIIETTVLWHELLQNLMQLQNEVSYVIECLGEDFRAEAVRGMVDAYECLQRTVIPVEWREQVNQLLDNAAAPINGRDLVTALRILYRLRRRLANQTASLMAEKLPYSEKLYPLLWEGGDDGEVGFKRVPQG